MQFSRRLHFSPIFFPILLILACPPRVVYAGSLNYSYKLVEDFSATDTVAQASPPQSAGNPSDHFFTEPDEDPFMLQNPGNLRTEIQYDPITNRYFKVTRVGDRIVGWPRYIEFDEFLQYDMDRSLRRFWDTKAQGTEMDRGDGIIPQIYVGGEVFDRI